MRHKLDLFYQFTLNLYPHEVDYLLSINNFNKDDNKDILEIIYHNTHFPNFKKDFDSKINKRTYSYVKSWIERTLEKADVDKFHIWLLDMERKVLSDQITPSDEKEIIANIKFVSTSHYYFLRFYDLLQHFRDYLLIRLRQRSYKPTYDYLKKNEKCYQKGIQINKQLNNATEEIIKQHKTLDADPIYFTDFLLSTFNDKFLDGYTRYKAAVRLTYLFYNYREFENLRSVYDELDTIFKTDIFYSKRLLSNYYANRSMMHSKLKELDLAEKFGYLSIRQKNSDYLFYLANLCGVLLRKGKKEEALKLMNNSMPELKNTGSFYTKIGFASFYTRTLVSNKLYKNAVDYASTFLDAYKKEIMETRWHLFFSSYFHALLSYEKYTKLVSISKRYNITNMERKYSEKTVYTPILLWYTEVALYMEGKITKEKLLETIIETSKKLLTSNYKSRRINEYLDSLYETIPTEITEIKRILFKTN